MAQQAARCCHVMSRSRTMWQRSEGISTVVSANGTRGANRSNNWRALARSGSPRRKPVPCSPKRITSPVAGSSHKRARSSGVHPPAMAHPFQAPAEAPTIKSGRKRSRNTLQTPTSQAAQSPPAESTSAVIPQRGIRLRLVHWWGRQSWLRGALWATFGRRARRKPYNPYGPNFSLEENKRDAKGCTPQTVQPLRFGTRIFPPPPPNLPLTLPLNRARNRGQREIRGHQGGRDHHAAFQSAHTDRLPQALRVLEQPDGAFEETELHHRRGDLAVFNREQAVAGRAANRWSLSPGWPLWPLQQACSAAGCPRIGQPVLGVSFQR